MPRRNLLLLLLFPAVCLPCHVRSSRYGQILSFAMDQVDHRSLRETPRRQLFEGAMTGMMAQLKDPHSVYIAPQEYAEVRQTLEQEFGGVGIEIALDPDTKQLTVATPLFGTPAFEAGVRPRDKILRVDGKSTQGMSLEDASGLLRGKIGTTVVLGIQHEGEDPPVDISIVRAKIQVDSVLGDLRNPDGTWNFFLEGRDRIGYVRINAFGERTAEELAKAMERLGAGGMQGLVLDLRNDPGGPLLAAVRVCDMFLESGVIVTTRNRSGDIRDMYQATGQGPYTRFPMAVLVNKFSASASEIVAACLQDHGRAVIVGERTFGKGTVQEIIRLPGREGAIKVTTASYWRPSGKNINRPHPDEPAGGRPSSPGEDAANRPAENDDNADWGVLPDPGCKVVLDKDQIARLARWYREVGAFRSMGARANGPPAPAGPQRPIDVDPQLARAVKHVEEESARQAE